MKNIYFGFFLSKRTDDIQGVVKAFALKLSDSLLENEWQQQCQEKQRIGLLKQYHLEKQQPYDDKIRVLALKRNYPIDSTVVRDTRVRFVLQNGIYVPNGSIDERFMPVPSNYSVMQKAEGDISNSALLIHQGNKPLDLLVVDSIKNLMHYRLKQFNAESKERGKPQIMYDIIRF